MDQDIPLTLSREDLYELAWSKPMSELSKDFGISDVLWQNDVGASASRSLDAAIGLVWRQLRRRIGLTYLSENHNGTTKVRSRSRRWGARHRLSLRVQTA
jgi:hypothetical protein